MLHSQSTSLYRQFIKEASNVRDESTKQEMIKEIRKHWEDSKYAADDELHMKSMLVQGRTELKNFKNMVMMLKG